MVHTYTLLYLKGARDTSLCEEARSFIENMRKAENKADYINTHVLDLVLLKHVYGDIEEVHLLLGTGGPILWLVIGEKYAIMIKVLFTGYRYCIIEDDFSDILNEVVEQ